MERHLTPADGDKPAKEDSTMTTALDEYREVSPKGTVDFLYRLSELGKGKSRGHGSAGR